MRTRYKDWTLLEWDGNRALKLQCWRKSFGRGHVSIGVGEFKHIVYSYGPDSDYSLSGTRARVGKREQTVKAAKAMVDRNKGIHNHLDTD